MSPKFIKKYLEYLLCECQQLENDLKTGSPMGMRISQQLVKNYTIILII